MLSRVRAASFGLALLVVTSAAIAQDSWTIAYAYKKGDVHKSKVNIKTSIMGTDLTIEQLSKDEITEVKADGTFVSKSSIEGGKVSIGGMDMDIPATPGGTSTRDKSGKLTDLKLESENMSPFSPEITRLMASINEPLFTSKAVKAGDTWEVTVDNAAVKGKKAVVKVTLVGAEKLNGKDVVKIKQTAEAATDDKDAKMKIDVTAWIDPKTGRTVKMEGKVTDIPSAQLGGNMSFEITMVERT